MNKIVMCFISCVVASSAFAAPRSADEKADWANGAGKASEIARQAQQTAIDYGHVPLVGSVLRNRASIATSQANVMREMHNDQFDRQWQPLPNYAQ